MILKSILIFLPAWVLGGCVVHLLWPGRDWRRWMLKAALGIGVGLGIVSLLYFVFLFIFPGRRGFFLIEVALAALTLAVVLWRPRRMRRAQADLPRSMPLTGLQIALLAAVGSAAGITLASFLGYAFMNPHGGFDAWMVYNRVARFLYRAPGDWPALLSADFYWFYHPDYPLLIPLNVALGWEALGGEITRVGMVQAGLFLFGSLALLWSALAHARSVGQASLAALVLMGMPVYVYIGSRQFADVPLALFVLGAVVSLFLYHREERPGLLTLAALMSGLAAWTKNEGLLLVVGSTLACLVLLALKKKLRAFTRFAAGLALPLTVVLYYKFVLAPPNDLLAGSSPASLAQLTDWPRYGEIFRRMVSALYGFSGWPLNLFGLLACLLILGFRVTAAERPGLLAVVLVIALQLLGYFAVYLLDPYPLDWHLGTSLARILLHLYPATLFLLFSVVSPLETAFRLRSEHAARH